MIIRSKDLSSDVNEKVDVCVIGSGAGGAVMAKELSEGGHSVVVLEEGGYFTRKDFNQKALDMYAMMYRDFGFTVAIGMPSIPIPTGKCIGGTTTINSGTCFRVPDYILKSWQENYGLEDLTSEAMRPSFERVEKTINVTPVGLDIIGKNALVFKRGTEALGFKGAPIARNAKDCRGCGVCVFGCPTDAKQAMHLNYIPLSSQCGAKIYANCRAERILTEQKRVKGVEGLFLDQKTNKKTHKMKVEAKVVILTANAFYSPALLLRNKLANSSGQVGKNLHIHPATRVTALFDEEIEGWKGVPQSYYVDEYFEEGIMLEGIFVPPNYGSASLPSFGKQHKELMKDYRHIAAFGVMVSDTSRGRVRIDQRGRPLITYRMNRSDTRKMAKGVAITSEIFFAAGAKKVFPYLPGLPEISSKQEVDRIRERRPKATDFTMMGFHPMGTCRMGKNRKKSVVNSHCESHDVTNLFICDGSIFPSSLGVNPQLSIMAFATHAANYINANADRYFQ
ncbi:MAG: GMC family oxidoreductase [Deltaproteobacteria bacterium]|nr:MAG: GMC family oxidoreductase [Deltaproteobacteria bacterium]